MRIRNTNYTLDLLLQDDYTKKCNVDGIQACTKKTTNTFLKKNVTFRDKIYIFQKP